MDPITEFKGISEVGEVVSYGLHFRVSVCNTGKLHAFRDLLFNHFLYIAHSLSLMINFIYQMISSISDTLYNISIFNRYLNY